MRVKSMHMWQFKRFTDITITDIPESTKLVVLVGPNGSGKSSVFDAFVKWQRSSTGIGISGDKQYYTKANDEEDRIRCFMHDSAIPAKDSLYVRTAYRNDSDFTSSQIDIQPSPVDRPNTQRLIDDDKTVARNYQRLLLNTIGLVFNEDGNEKSRTQIRDELIGQIRESMTNVFGDLILNSITDALGAGGGAFYFGKGTATSYHYKNLSGGEKAAFDLILDMQMKKQFFPDAIYCIDEIETHLHSRIQGTLLKELFRITPEQSQLWVSTHSLGVIRAAQLIEKESPSSVSIIDFEGVDLDSTVTLRPTSLDRVSWQKVLSVTLNDLSGRLGPETVVVCEGTSKGNGRKDYDASIYNSILGERTLDLVFLSGGASSQLESTGNTLRDTLRKLLPDTKVVPLIDRDDRSSEEVKEWETEGGLVLGKRSLESYLLADDVIEALVKSVDKENLLDQALACKSNALQENIARGKPPDDLKSASGTIYNGLKDLLGLERRGQDADAFMRSTMAPLIVPGLATYEELKSEIVDKVA